MEGTARKLKGRGLDSGKKRNALPKPRNKADARKKLSDNWRETMGKMAKRIALSQRTRPWGTLGPGGEQPI